MVRNVVIAAMLILENAQRFLITVKELKIISAVLVVTESAFDAECKEV